MPCNWDMDVLDRQLEQSSDAVGDFRPALVLIVGGAGLLLSAMTGIWAGSALVPASLGVAAFVYGIYLALLNSSALWGKSSSRQRLISYHMAGHEPVYLTDLNGRLNAVNAAARGKGFVEAWATDPKALVYRLTREAGITGWASEDIDSLGGRVQVTRIDGETLLWRVVRHEPAPIVDIEGLEFELPWISVTGDGRINGFNSAAGRLSGRRPVRIEDVIVDGPLTPDGYHTLHRDNQIVRALVLRESGDVRDVLLCPLEGAEVSGLAPDQFLEELPVALARLDSQGTLSYANRAARQLLGEDARSGVNISDLIEGLGRSIAERLRDTRKGRGLGRSEVARGKTDGNQLFLQVAFTNIVHQGEAALMAVLSDATELKTLEAQFVQSQKMQAVGQLAGGVAHDFNNLLTAINGHCDLLLMRHDVADVEHGDLMQIRQNANRAAALVRQLLAFSRKQTLRPTVINLQDTLSELTHLLNRLLSEKVTLQIKHGANLAPVRVDERQFEQVIMNLVVNSRDAMPRGGEVRISTRSVHLKEDLHRDRAVVFKGDYVVVEVADSGTGIPKDKLNKIFEPFFTTKQVGEGTGLGLSTVYGIIKQTGGFIFADSPSGGGATFTIYLPAYDRTDPPGPVESEVKQPRDLTGRGLVLLVEDEDAVRSFAARALQLRGYTVVEAASGEEALDLLKDGSLEVDILLSDVIMPGLDGPAWVREARKTRPDTKVVFMSGYTEDAFSGGDSGIPDAGFLPKPFSLPELTQKVKETLDS